MESAWAIWSGQATFEQLGASADGRDCVAADISIPLPSELDGGWEGAVGGGWLKKGGWRGRLKGAVGGLRLGCNQGYG